MESLTHDSDDSSSCTQSDTTNSSNERNRFMLCPRAGSSGHLEISRDGNSLNTVEDNRPFKLSYTTVPSHHHRAVIENPQGTGTSQYLHNSAATWITGSDGRTGSMLHSQNIIYPSSVHEECRNPIGQPASAAGFQHGGLHYPGPTQSFYAPDQWAELRQRQEAYVLKHVTRRDPTPSAVVLPMRCKIKDAKAGSFLLGLADGRCRRTDGKKWRCGRAVVPNQKYCERHMHRGRGRSKAARVAKGNTPANNQPLHGNQPLNKPLVQLLNQLAVPVQSSSQLPNTGQPHNQYPIQAQPLNWLPKVPLACTQQSNDTPMIAQPLNEPFNRAKLFDQPTAPSKALDWPRNQPPIQSKLFNSEHGLKPAQTECTSITFATRRSYLTKIKDFKEQSMATNEMVPCSTPMQSVLNANGSVISNTSRRHMDDLDNILTLDVEGIKRLLENAPCNKRPRLPTRQLKTSLNLVNSPDVSHPGRLSSPQKQRPSLADILKMVEPPTLTSTTLNFQQLPTSAICSGKESTVNADTPLHLAWHEQGRGGNISNSMATLRANTSDMFGASAEGGATLLPLFKVKCEEEQEVAQRMTEDGEGGRHMNGCCSLKPITSANTSSTLECSYSPQGLQGKISTNKSSPALMEEMDHHIPGLVDESSSPHGNAAKLDMNVCSSAEEKWEHPLSPTKLKKNSPALLPESLKLDVNACSLVNERWEHPASPSRLDGPAKSEENCSIRLVEESSDQHESSAKIEIDLSIDIEKSLDQLEVSTKDSPNSIKGSHGSSCELEGNRGGSMFLPEALQMVGAMSDNGLFSNSSSDGGNSPESSLNQGAVAV